MSNKKQSKIKAKIPQIKNPNKDLNVITTKLRSDNSDVATKKVTANNLPTISESIRSKISNNETIVKLFPDIELSMQILTSSILSPNDMVSTNLIYSAEDVNMPSDVKVGLLDAIKNYISKNYDLEDKLPTILRESMFTKGAYVEAVIPEASIDAMINDDVGKSKLTGSLESFVDLNESIKPVGILGSYKPTDDISLEGLDITMDLNTDDKVAIEDKDLLVDITDNYGLLGATGKMAEAIGKRISNEMLFQKDEDMVTKDEDKLFNDLFRPIDPENKKSSVTVLTSEQTGRDTIGKPLITKLPVESVIPVHVTGDVSKHLGYFVLLNEKGSPITSSTEWDVPGQDGITPEMTKRAKSIIDKAATNINGYSKKDPTIEDMESIYSHIVINKIKKKISNGVLSDLADINTDNTDLYKIMWERVLRNKKTKLLFIPSELVTYYAFRYRENGTGESLLETVTVLSSIRAILMFARIMANVKNSVTTTEIDVTLDDDDPDPAKTMDKIISEVMKGRQTQLPIGINRVEDLVDWSKKVGNKFNFKHKSLPDMDVNTNDSNTSKTVPDSDLDEEVRKQILMAFALPPKAVEDGYDSDFATTIVQSNVLFTKRVMKHQDTLMTIVTEHVQRLIKNDSNLRDIVKEAIENNYSIILKYIKKTSIGKDKDIDGIDKNALVNWLIDKYTNSIEITLPRIEEHQDDNMKEAFDNYKDSLDDIIELFFDSESIPEELSGLISEKTEDFQFAIKNALIRKWMADNNYMPELLKSVSIDQDGKPVLDVYSEYTSYVEALTEIFVPFMKENKKKKKKNDKKIEKVDGDDDGEDDDGSNNNDDADSGNDNASDIHNEVNDDDVGGDNDDDADGNDNDDDDDEGTAPKESDDIEFPEYK